MDQNAVYQLFVATYNPDPNIHKQAELNIKNVKEANTTLARMTKLFSNLD
jgi:hypothetical protein